MQRQDGLFGSIVLEETDYSVRYILVDNVSCNDLPNDDIQENHGCDDSTFNIVIDPE